MLQRVVRVMELGPDRPDIRPLECSNKLSSQSGVMTVMSLLSSSKCSPAAWAAAKLLIAA